jgi:hypothetical protein
MTAMSLNCTDGYCRNYLSVLNKLFTPKAGLDITLYIVFYIGVTFSSIKAVPENMTSYILAFHDSNYQHAEKKLHTKYADNFKTNQYIKFTIIHRQT